MKINKVMLSLFFLITITIIGTAQETYKLRDTGPAGGIIFYDKGNNSGGWRYLEAAPEDIKRRLVWTTEEIFVERSSERAVGKGRTNTKEIMAAAAEKGGGFGWAAQACDKFEYNGFDDWFLPSRDELNYMYGNLHMRGLGDFRNDYYWSSTVGGWGGRVGDRFLDVRAWMQDFSNGEQSNNPINNSFFVRPIRQVAGPN